VTMRFYDTTTGQTDVYVQEEHQHETGRLSTDRGGMDVRCREETEEVWWGAVKTRGTENK
jgi:hypothetical protein